MENWFTDTFSSKASADDLVKARSLNITRITGVVIPVLAGISVAIGELADKPPFNDSAFQRQIVLALIALITVVATADILGRSIANRGSHAPVGTILPKPMPARLREAGAAGIDGQVVAFRDANSSNPGPWGEYLFVPDDLDPKKPDRMPSWQLKGDLDFLERP
jgi:hypothetical protein